MSVERGVSDIAIRLKTRPDDAPVARRRGIGDSRYGGSTYCVDGMQATGRQQQEG